MSELLILALKFAFLALLWLFVLFAANVIRTDLFGRKVSAASLPAEASAAPAPKLSWRERRKKKSAPTTLRITRGAQAGLTTPLGDSLKIGRSNDCQLILDDDYVSTNHARIYSGSRGLMIEDLGSTNGTYVNDERVLTPTLIGTNDLIRIGRTVMSVEA